MNKPVKLKPRSQGKRTKKGFIISNGPQCWIAQDQNDPTSGFLLFNENTRTYHAWTSEIAMLFPRFSTRCKSPEDLLVDQHHYPKGDFLMLLALRERFEEHVPESDFVARGWRELAFMKKRQEFEQANDKVVSDKNWSLCMEIVASGKKFEEYVAAMLVRIARSDDAGDQFIRLGKWLQKAGQIERAEIPNHYLRFFKAVETAAEQVGGVPKQKDVQAVYEDGLSANQLGSGNGFRDTMRHLQFDWLPAGGRGPAKQQRKSGIR